MRSLDPAAMAAVGRQRATLPARCPPAPPTSTGAARKALPIELVELGGPSPPVLMR